jgi:hypothetical protein
MATRYYSSVAAETTLVASITNGNTSIQIASATGLPALTPFTLALDYESASEELVEVTAVAGTTLTVTRGIDGTSAAAHNAGARVRHVSSARDFSDSRTHEQSATNVHGTAVGSAVVGTNDTQTLSNKTLNNATGTLSNVDIFAGATWVTTVNGTAAGTVDLMKWTRDPSAAHEVAKITNNGNLFIRNQDAAADAVHNTYRIRVTFDNGTTDTFRVLSGGQVDIFGKDPTASVLDVQAAASQSGDIMRVQDSSSATLMAVQSTGKTLANRGATIAQPGVTSGAVLQVGGSNVGYTGNLTQWVSPGNAIVGSVNQDGAASFSSSVTAGGALTANGLAVLNAGADVTGALTVTGHSAASGTSVITAAAGFSVDAATQGVLKSGWIIVTGVLLRTGGTLTASAAGNLTDTALCTIQSSWRPDTVFGTDRVVTSFGTGFTSGGVGLNPSTGVVELLDAHSTSIIDTGHTVRFTYVYPQ